MRPCFAALAMLLALSTCQTVPAFARDQGQWKDADSLVSEWFKTLKQPKSNASCCGVADAYWADAVETDPVTGGIIAIITDTRPDEWIVDGNKVYRPHVDVGTRIPVPREKIRKPALFNPTGHTIIFLATGAEEGTVYTSVYCYEPLPGI